jgi:hypothetical protein
VDEARGDPPRRQPGRGLDHGAQEAGRVSRRDLRVVEGARMLDQGLDHVLAAQIRRPLEGAEADMAVRQPDQHRRPRRRRLVAALQASPVSIRLKARLVGTPSASSISAASTSRIPPFSVSRPSATRATTASGP